MGLLSATLKTELQKADADAAFLFEFVLGGVTYRFSDAGRQSTAPYAAKVLSWGGALRRGISTYDPTLDMPTLEILLDDTDLTLTTLFMGALRNQVRGAAATITLASRNVTSGNWLTFYSGRIDAVSQPAPLTWSIQLTTNALPLKRESVPKPRINLSDWPSSLVSVRDLPMPVIYGRISSSNGNNDGAVPAHLVDASGFRYLVAAGRMKAIDTVYKDGVPVAASAYAITYPVVGGRTVTLIDFTSTQGSSTITCDVQGYESVGDGSGTLLTDPATVLKHLLVNWIYGDYKTGAWLSDGSAPVDTTSFGTTFFSDRGYQCSVYIGGAKRRGLDVVNDMLKSLEARACWTLDGKIALKVEDFTAWSYPTNVLREDECSGWKFEAPISQLVDSVEAEYAQTPTGGYTQGIAVKDLDTGEQAPDTVQLPFSPAFYL